MCHSIATINEITNEITFYRFPKITHDCSVKYADDSDRKHGYPFVQACHYDDTTQHMHPFITSLVQLRTSADNVALTASTAARRAAARLLLTAGPPAMQQSIDISCLSDPQQQTRCSGVRWANNGIDRQRQTYRETVGRTDTRHFHRSCSEYNSGSAKNDADSRFLKYTESNV